MTYYRCSCGQPLAVFVSDVAGIGLPVPAPEHVAERVRASLERHLGALSTAEDEAMHFAYEAA
ncbi:hypothetical protein [Nocardioides sp. GXQ0305]|uniref:hypothetical protein n=1 Tax=Nocardioides sp. GXQ0305 TaxID=3423912 RepID=UPI003D7DC37D